MEPFIIGVVSVVGASVIAAIRARRRRRQSAASKALPAGAKALTTESGKVIPASTQARVGDVLSHLGDEFWLSGELALVREGAVVMRLFSAPERGKERWVALPRDGKSLWILFVDSDLQGVGWPGVEVPIGGKMFRRDEQSRAAVMPSGEVSNAWEGVGRYATFKSLDAVAVVLESASVQRLALVGREVPWQLVEKVG